MSQKIGFNKTSILGNELQYITEAIEGAHISGDGSFTKKSQSFLENLLGVPKVLLTTSCTHALEMAALLVNIQPDDEVIVPSFTFVSTINAFVLRGARPVFIDIRSDTLNMDERLLPRLISERTRAILPVHYAGVGCEMDTIMSLANQHGIPVIEDNAHALFAKYRGKYLGTFGAMATQSFHETKNISCGEGGAVLFNDPQYIERAEIIREKGTNRSRFYRGQVDKYTWVDAGSSYLPSDILAAFLYGQLESYQKIQSKRKHIWDYYNQHLPSWAALNDVLLPFVPEYDEQSYHMYYMLLPNLKTRQAFIEHLKRHDIMSVFHYVPLHTSDMGQRYGYHVGDCPVTENSSDRLVRLPFYYSLGDAELEKITEAIFNFQV